ncbi:MAG TPA: Fur family transcriptional regulator [Candidatus Binatia bacterium]|nr:Fur family transcriptional regulator [Candidatus Binatia bacterium]
MYNSLQESLRSSGYSLTAARKVLFKVLLESEPMSMKNILIKCQGVDRASIYRNIELFEQLGIVRRLTIGWRYKLELSDQFVAHHHHLSCLNCGKVIDIQDEKHIDNFIQEVTSQFGFMPTRHQFEIEGSCKDCQNKKTTS